MENFGSEIGQKMRSAVKAKLVELGTGGTAGYIDDELPDYVMIMVANKRSKQQMIADLNLFLGSQTELFVTWLHEVLQKLQEVTLPATIATKKRKAEPKQDVSSKKERKSNKKERKISASKKAAEEVQSAAVNTTEKSTSSSTPTVPPINSITDVFADVFLEKAKKNLNTAAEAAAHIKKAKSGNKTASSETTKNSASKLSNDKSNMATSDTASKEQRYNGATDDSSISISKNVTPTAPVSSGNREKDLAELAEIQKKIYAAKKHLRQLGELEDNSDDDDFINLKEDGTEEEVENLSPKAMETPTQTPTEHRGIKRRSPIIFDAGEKKSDDKKSHENEASDRSARFTPPPPTNCVVTKPSSTSEYQNTNNLSSSQPLLQKQNSQEREKSRNREHERDRHDSMTEVPKKPVHERLGIRPPAVREAQQQQRRTREDKQLFVPSFRRKDNDNERDREREREKEREREREHDRNREREREREREKERERERQRDRDRDRERERGRLPARLRGRSEDRRKDRDLERERERPRERGRERSRDAVENRRKGSVPRMRRSLSPILRRTTTTNEPRTLPNITVSAIVKPNYANKSIIAEKKLEEKMNSSTSETSTESEESSDDEENKVAHSPQTQRQRIGSRVIVAPVKQVESSEDEDKSLNSIIKIKPRAPVSPSKQACKTLLLRAVAEAQRSTIIKARHKEEKAAPNKVSNIVQDPTDERKLYTKAYRERLKRGAKVTSTSATSSNLFRRATQNLVIKVESDMPLQKRRRAQIDDVEVEEQAHSDAEELEESEELEEKYVPGTVFQRVDSNINYMYVPQMIRIKNEEHESAESEDSDEVEEDVNANAQQTADKLPQRKTQFVVTLNDEKAALKFMSRAKAALKRVRSESPLQEVSSSSSVARSKRAEASSTTTTTTKSTQASRPRSGGHENEHSRRASIKSRLSAKVMPSSTVPRFSDHESSNSLSATPPLRRSDLVETYRKPKEIKKIIIKNDTDDEEMSPKKLSSTIVVGNGNQQRKHKRTHSVERNQELERSNTPPSLRKIDTRKESRTPPKRKRSSNSSQYEGRARAMNNSDINDDDVDVEEQPVHKRRSRSDDSTRMRERGREREREHELHNRERERAASRDYSAERHSGEERRKISTRNVEAKKYDNIPSLSSVTLDSSAVRVMKTKERCKYHPNCTKQFCDYYHPTAPCKSFPNCKFADKCLYSHPHCKYDLACTNLDCNYAHSGPRDPAQLVPQAPPLSSHVVPVQNYKSISATAAANSTMCKYYPTCTKVGCTFYHPKPCRFGKNCINKLECNFYHHEVQSSSKFKWVASVV